MEAHRQRMAWLDETQSKLVEKKTKTWLDEVSSKREYRSRDRWELEDELRHMDKITRSLRLTVAEKDDEVRKWKERDETNQRTMMGLQGKIDALQGIRELTTEAQRELANLRDRLSRALEETAVAKGNLDAALDDAEEARKDAAAEKVLVGQLTEQLATCEATARDEAAAKRSRDDQRAKEKRDSASVKRKFDVTLRELEDLKVRTGKLEDQVDRGSKIELALREALCDRDSTISQLQTKLEKTEASARLVRLDAARANDLDRDVKRLITLLSSSAEYKHFASLWGTAPGAGQSYFGDAEAAFLFGFEETKNDVITSPTARHHQEMSPTTTKNGDEVEWSYFAAALAPRYGPSDDPLNPKEGDKWVPRRVAAAARDFVDTFQVPADDVRKFVANANKAWAQREQRRVHRVRHAFHTRIATLHRKNQQRQSMDGVIAQQEILRLKKLLQQHRKPTSSAAGAGKMCDPDPTTTKHPGATKAMIRIKKAKKKPIHFAPRASGTAA